MTFWKATLFVIVFALLASPLSGATLTAQYDDLGRLIEVSTNEGSKIEYDYDLNGNLLAQTVEGGATPTPTPTMGGEMTPTPCNTFDLSADCRIDANDLIALLEQTEDLNELFEFSTHWQENLND